MVALFMSCIEPNFFTLQKRCLGNGSILKLKKKSKTRVVNLTRFNKLGKYNNKKKKTKPYINGIKKRNN